MIDYKQYDFTSLNDLFNSSMSPKELSDEIAKLMFNYAIGFDEELVEDFKNDACTIYMLYKEVRNIKEIVRG